MTLGSSLITSFVVRHGQRAAPSAKNPPSQALNMVDIWNTRLTMLQDPRGENLACYWMVV